jgi:FixJ family two-component response regulator
MPVIFITGQDRTGMEERAMRLGATAYLRKPFDEETLMGAIRTAMKSPSKEKGKGSGIDRKGTS